MSSQLVFEALWRDRGVAAGLKSIGSDAEASAAKVGKLSTTAKVGLLAAGAAILKFGVSSVKAYSDAETSQAKLGFAFQKFPKLADSSQASLQKLNAALQLKTKFDDDAIASGQAVLAQYGLTGKELERVTPLLLDYAAKTGKDLPAAAAAMGKSFLGNTRALKEIGINYKSTGNQAKDFANITELMRHQIGGFAEGEGKTAAGQLEILKNQFGELQEAAGAKLVPALTQVTGLLIKGVQVVGQYSGVIGPVTVGIGALAAVIWTATKAQAAWQVTQALSGGLAVKAVGGLNALKVAFTGVELTSVAAGRAMRVAQLSIPVVGIALFAASTAMAAWATKGADGTAAANEFSTSMQSVQGNITQATAALNENVRATAVNALQSKGAFDQARLLGIGLDELTDAALGNEYAIKAVNAQIKSGYGGTSAQVKASMELGRTFRLTSDAATAATKAEQDRRAAMGAGATASEAAAAAAEADAKKQKEHAAQLQAVADKARAAASALLGLSGSQIGMEAAIDAATASAKENGRTLDVNTAKGRANKQTLDSLAGATLQYTDGLIKSGASASKVVAANERGRASFIKSARAMGASKAEATALASALFQIPDSVKSQVVVAGGKISVKQAKDLNAALKGIPKEQRARIVTIANTKGAKAAQAEIKRVKDKNAKINVSSNAKKATSDSNKETGKAKGKNTKIDVKSNAKSTTSQSNRDTNKAHGKTTKIDVNSNARPVASSSNRAVNSVHGKSVNIDVNSNAGRVAAAARAAINRVNSRTVVITTLHKSKKAGAAFGGSPHLMGFASGGTPGGRVQVGSFAPRKDDVDISVSRDEWIIQRSSSRKYGDAAMAAVNAGTARIEFARGGSPGGRARDLVGAGMRGGGVQMVNVNLHVGTLIGNQASVKRLLEDMKRNGQLKSILS